MNSFFLSFCFRMFLLRMCQGSSTHTLHNSLEQMPQIMGSGATETKADNKIIPNTSTLESHRTHFSKQREYVRECGVFVFQF